jgi:hypothetical protein
LPDILDVLISYWPNALIGAFILVLALHFFFRFLCPAVKLRLSLRRIVKCLRKPEIGYAQKTGDLHAVVAHARSNPAFSLLWFKYSKTLHVQSEVDGTGQRVNFRWRATTLAETFFTQQALVDSPLRTDYFKHLPGILTGLGIIGTFAGLIRGLNHFDVSLQANEMQGSLGNLINAVGHAFYVSAAAICLEKSLLNRCYVRVDEIQNAIDGLFHAGVGEEYLERLVKASETAASQALQIKDSLVADLKQILAEVATNQASASARNSGYVSTAVGKVVAESLGDPMRRISVAIERVSCDQGVAIKTALLDVMAGFSEQMREMLSGQMQVVGDLLTQTTKGAQENWTGFQRLASTMDSADNNLEQIRTLVSQSQAEIGETLQRTISGLGEQVLRAVEELKRQTRTSDGLQHEESARIAGQTAVSGLSREVQTLISQSLEMNRSLQGSFASLSGATGDSINRMNAGADLIYTASRGFAKAGEGVTASIKASSEAVDKIQAAANSLGNAMNGTAEVFNEYKQNRDAFAMIVSDLKATVQNAKREASMTSDLVERLQGAASQLGRAQKQSEDYLKGINEVLAKAHEAFAANIEKTLNRGNSQFHVELSTAVSLLSAGVQDLGDMFERVSASR